MSKLLFVLKVLFGLAIFVGGTWLTIMLVIERLYAWSGLSGFIAIIGAIIPFLGNNKEPEEPPLEPSSYTPPPKPTAAPIQQKSTANPGNSNELSDIPEDSTLRRHYLTHQQNLKEQKNTPAPVAAKIEPTPAPAPEPITKSEAPAPVRLVEEISAAQQTPAVQNDKPSIPEDSTLRRHFLNHIQGIITAKLPPRPTDSTLARHYDTMLKSEIDTYLQG